MIIQTQKSYTRLRAGHVGTCYDPLGLIPLRTMLNRLPCSLSTERIISAATYSAIGVPALQNSGHRSLSPIFIKEGAPRSLIRLTSSDIPVHYKDRAHAYWYRYFAQLVFFAETADGNATVPIGINATYGIAV